MKKLFLAFTTVLLLFAGCSSSKEESKKEEALKPIDPHTPEEVRNLLTEFGFSEKDLSGTMFYQLDRDDSKYLFMFIPSENSYSLSFGYGSDFDYCETSYLSFVSIDLSEEVSCTYYPDTEKLKEGEDSACDDSVIKKAKEGMEVMNTLMYDIGISKEDLVSFAKQCSENYYNSKKGTSSFDIEKESDGQFTMNTLHDLNYVVGTDWIKSTDEADKKSYGYFNDKGEIMFIFTVSRNENENQTQPEELYAYVSMANSIDSVANSGITYENQNLVITNSGVKIVRYSMVSSENSNVYIAADVLTDEDHYTLSMVGEDYLKDNLNELFDTLVKFAELN